MIRSKEANAMNSGDIYEQAVVKTILVFFHGTSKRLSDVIRFPNAGTSYTFLDCPLEGFVVTFSSRVQLACRSVEIRRCITNCSSLGDVAPKPSGFSHSARSMGGALAASPYLSLYVSIIIT